MKFLSLVPVLLLLGCASAPDTDAPPEAPAPAGDSGLEYPDPQKQLEELHRQLEAPFRGNF